MKILIKGAGDLATGIAVRLYQSGYTEIVMTDIAVPTTVRRAVAFSRAVYEETAIVEEITARVLPAEKRGVLSLIKMVHGWGEIAVLVDEKARIRESYCPDVVVDAILAKRNLGTTLGEAELVIGVGPGFTAGTDCHAVVETKRGHYLGRVLYEGSAIPNTGIPGEVAGYSTERIIRATAEGVFEPVTAIGGRVQEGALVAYIRGEGTYSEDKVPVRALMGGIVRGILQPGVQVHVGMKAGDIDPRCERNHCFTVSDKARAVGGGVLEAICKYEHR